MNKNLANRLLGLVSILYFPALFYVNFNIFADIGATVLLVWLLIINIRLNKKS